MSFDGEPRTARGRELKAKALRRRAEVNGMMNALAGAYVAQTGRQLARFQQKTENAAQQRAPQRQDRNTKQALEALTK